MGDAWKEWMDGQTEPLKTMRQPGSSRKKAHNEREKERTRWPDAGNGCVAIVRE